MTNASQRAAVLAELSNLIGEYDEAHADDVNGDGWDLDTALSILIIRLNAEIRLKQHPAICSLAVAA